MSRNHSYVPLEPLLCPAGTTPRAGGGGLIPTQGPGTAQTAIFTSVEWAFVPSGYLTSSDEAKTRAQIGTWISRRAYNTAALLCVSTGTTFDITGAIYRAPTQPRPVTKPLASFRKIVGELTPPGE